MEKSKELEAIEKIDKQIDGLVKQLGDKVNKDELSSLKDAIDQIKKIVDNLNSSPNAPDPAAEKMLNDLIIKINGDMKKMDTQIGEMQRDVENQKKSKKSRGIGKSEITDQVRKFIEDTFDKNTRKKTKDSAEIRIKAAEIFSIPNFFDGAEGTDSSAFTGRVVDPELYQRRRKTNLILDYLSISTINVPKLLFLVKEEISGADASSDDVGSADWITSGAEKPMRSFRVTTGEVDAKKVAIFGTIEDKLLRDVSSLETWVREDFIAEMREAYNDALLNNNPAINEDAPLGLLHNAVQYIGSDAFANTVVDPTLIDVIIAMAADMAVRREEPAFAFISKDNWYAIQSLKDNQARYQNNPLVYTTKLGQLYIAGVQVIGVDVEDIPATHVLMIGAEVGFQIKNYSDLVFERGLNGEDFRHDRTSYRGYQEVLSYLPTHRENSVMYDTIVNVSGDIIKTS